MPGKSALQPHAEFMQVWEEGYVGTTESFVAMHMQGVAIFAGAPFRTADGTLDRNGIRSWIESATRGVPYARLRLQRGLLGLTPPAWVPAQAVDMATHVRFGDEDELSAQTLRRLVGWDEGPLDLGAPLWRLRVTPLADGRVAIGVLMHHAGGDALRTLRFLASLTTSAPDAPAPAPEPLFVERRAPRAGGLAVLAVRLWWGASDSMGSRWRAYWRKPLLRRARRVAARVTRPLRDRPARPLTLHSGFRRVDGIAAQRAAEAAGGTMNDLVVAAAIRAGSGDGGGAVRVRVPVLRRATEASRNRITDADVAGAGGAAVDELVRSVRAQLASARDGAADAAVPDARPLGYATLVPWLSRPRYLRGAKLEDAIVLPAGLPDDELSTFALLYDEKLSVVVTTPASTRLEPILDDLEAILTGR